MGNYHPRNAPITKGRLTSVCVQRCNLHSSLLSRVLAVGVSCTVPRPEKGLVTFFEEFSRRNRTAPNRPINAKSTVQLQALESTYCYATSPVARKHGAKTTCFDVWLLIRNWR